jgi:acyl-CoA synthetase (AMP-forming)/AMP-acid ligase II
VHVPDLLRNPARRFPGRLCVSEGPRSITFAQADQRADRVAAGLRKQGVQPGDRVGLLALNDLEYLEIQVGVQRAGAILVPLNFRLSVAELAYLIHDSGTTVLIHGPELAEVARQLAVGRTFYLGDHGHGDPYDSLLASTGESHDGPELEADAAVNILYTSGTTGRPKGALLTNFGLYARSVALALDIRARPGSLFVQTLPMFHIAANTAYSFTLGGSSLVMLKEFSVERVVDTLHDRQATHVLLVPTTINLINNAEAIEDQRFEHLDMVIYGASTIAPEVLRRAITVFGCDFLQLYGMTETFACSLLRPDAHDPDGHPELLGSAGTDAVSYETRVVDDQDRSCPDGTVGEIVARGPALMTGYWNAPEETISALRGGWMHTGDLGYRGDNGFLYVTDRLKDMIISGGENIYPREIEDVLYTHPGVLEAAVIGLPDEEWHERVHAVVVLRPGASVTEAEVVEYCRSALARYKCPKTVQFVDDLPKNATGKILKRELRTAVRPGPAAVRP